jgi:hypothetical protein
LLTLAASAGLALVGVALHLLAILVVTAGLLICVTGCWYAVSRRGLIRMISLLVVVGALGGTIAGLFFAGIRWYLLVLIAALAAGSVLAARHALRRTILSLDGRFSAKALDVLATSFVDTKALPSKPDMTTLYTEAFLPAK